MFLYNFKSRRYLLFLNISFIKIAKHNLGLLNSQFYILILNINKRAAQDRKMLSQACLPAVLALLSFFVYRSIYSIAYIEVFRALHLIIIASQHIRQEEATRR